MHIGAALPTAPVRAATTIDRPFAAAPRPGIPAAAEGPDGRPASDIARRYGNDLLAVPGAFKLSWGTKHPALLNIDFRDAADARIAAWLYATDIDGVQLVVRHDGTPIVPTGHASASEGGRLARAVASMRGVWDMRYAETSQFEDGRVTFRTIDKAATERLDPILRDRVPFGWRPDTGEPRWLRLLWRSGVPKNS